MDDMTTGTTSAAAPSAAPTSAAPPPETPPASATATPSATAAPAPDRGPIPYERFEEVIRAKQTLEDQLKTARAFQDQHGWVEDFQRDPLPALEQWLDQLSGHPEMGPKLLAKAARMLQSRRGQAAPVQLEEPPPDIPIIDDKGHDTGRRTYSAEQLKKWREWDWAQREATLNERLSPLEQAQKRQQDAERRAQLERDSTESAAKTLDTLRKDPFFKEHEAAIKAEFAAKEEYGDNVALAALTVLTRDVLPKRDAQTSAKVLDHLQTQANGATVHPSGVTAASKPQFKDFGDALRYFHEHPEEAAAFAHR